MAFSILQNCKALLAAGGSLLLIELFALISLIAVTTFDILPFLKLHKLYTLLYF